jgi:hypothetical protein
MPCDVVRRNTKAFADLGPERFTFICDQAKWALSHVFRP